MLSSWLATNTNKEVKFLLCLIPLINWRIWFCYLKGIKIHFFPLMCVYFLLLHLLQMHFCFFFFQISYMKWFTYWFSVMHIDCAYLKSNLIISLKWILININITTRFDVVPFFIHEYFDKFANWFLICFAINQIHRLVNL